MKFLKNILAPIDFSRNSSLAVQYACDLALESGATLHLVHVSKDELDSTDREKRLERVGFSINAQTELQLDTIKRVVIGVPGDSISEYARNHEIDLIVMGTHGRTGLAHLAMGSVAENVLREAPCPVTVLGPHDGENATLSHVVVELEKMLADGWAMDQEMGRSLMAKRLVDSLRMALTTAILMVDELEYREWLKWENGSWFIVEGNELIDEFGPAFVEQRNDSNAVDLLKRARRLRATDIHIDPVGDAENIVRMRIDGQLRKYCRLDRSVADHLMTQYKTLAQLDISDPFHPLEGRLRLPSIKDVEVRLSSVPVAEGQAMALRILDPRKILQPLSSLGFCDSDSSKVEKMLGLGEGLILVTGPTGSGKTTTVYSMLATIGGEEKNIVSIEDPVEYIAPFVRQINVDEKHGVTLATGLRTILRMDPDALFVGEIRDPEAAEIAMRAATSGRYVFSTMHTLDVVSTLAALDQLDISQASIASHLAGIVNQRLLRRLCKNCRKPSGVCERTRALYVDNNLEVPNQLFFPTGCAQCNGRGYRGRIGVFEVAIIEPGLKSAIIDHKNTEWCEILTQSYFRTLQQDALIKVADGITSLAEAKQTIPWAG